MKTPKIVKERPAETASPVAMAVAVLVGRLFDFDAETVGYLAILVGDDREVDRAMLGFVDIISPPEVFIHRVYAYGQHACIAAGKFFLQQRGFSEFRCANGRVIGGMRKKNTPAIAQVFMKVNVTNGGVGLEIGCDIA